MVDDDSNTSARSVPVDEETLQALGNWKIIDGENTFLKIINFPVPEDCPVAGESMWVKKISGTDNDGIGVLNNVPAFCEEVSLDDTVRYGGGTDEAKPHYVEKVDG